MAEHKDQDDPTSTHRITPREVEPDHRTTGGGATSDHSTAHDRTLRRDPEVVEAPGGDIAGVAGGSVDSNVSGLGGDKNRR
jgi:hypothetical protein